MKLVTGIDAKALQLSIIILRQYNPEVATLLPGPDKYPSPGADVSIQVEASTANVVVDALNAIGKQWLAERSRSSAEQERDYYRQNCLTFVLSKWMAISKQCEQHAHTPLQSAG